jgi:aconitase A
VDSLQTRDSVMLGVRLDTRRGADYYRHGGVLPYVLRTVLDPGRGLPPT